MPTFTAALTNVYQPLVDLSALPVLYFHIEIINYDGQPAMFTFGDPNFAQPEIFVPATSSNSKDNRPLRGMLYGKVASGSTTVQINIW